MMDNTFHIQDDKNETVLYLSADSESDKTLWINALSKSIERLRSQFVDEDSESDSKSDQGKKEGGRKGML